MHDNYSMYKYYKGEKENPYIGKMRTQVYGGMVKNYSITIPFLTFRS